MSKNNTKKSNNNLMSKRYDGANCPCPISCTRKGKCKACIAFHHDLDEKTYCEKIYDAEIKPSRWSRFKKFLIWARQFFCPM